MLHQLCHGQIAVVVVGLPEAPGDQGGITEMDKADLILIFPGDPEQILAHNMEIGLAQGQTQAVAGVNIKNRLMDIGIVDHNATHISQIRHRGIVRVQQQLDAMFFCMGQNRI